MLILYKKSERQFLSNGIGRLDKHAFDDKVREELNGIYKLEFTYPIHAPHSKDIKNDNIVRATVPDGEQPFFISRIVKKDGYLRVTAYHLFYRLIWQLIEDINIVNLNGQAALNRVLENTEFTGVSDIATTKNIRIVRYNAVEAILNPGKDNTLISRFGGELKRDKLTVMLMNRIGRTYENNPVEIRYAKNLLSYEADISDSNVATRVMPIGFDGLLLPEKYVVKPGADPADYKTVKVEYTSIRAISNPDSPKEGELPLEDAYEALRQAVLSDFEIGRFDLKASYQVRFQELSTTEEYKNKSVLEKVYLGDEIKVIHTDEDLQILSRVVAYEWSPIRKEYDEVELGSHIDTFSDIKPTLELIAGKVEQYKTDWENNVDEITELLTTALGGYVLKRPGELLIMDTEDPSTATKVWRWNLNGLGYSGTGINGPYETAITMDGRIIAKFIYTLNLSSISADLGTVTAGRIEDGSGVNYWDLNTGDMNLNEIKIAGKKVSLSLSEINGDINSLELTASSLTNRISDTEGNVSTLQNTATSLTNRISDAEGNVSTLQNTAAGLTSRVSNAEGNISTLQNTAQGLAIDIAAADGRALNAQAKADSVEITFKSTGGMNYVENGKFGDGINGYSYYWMAGTGDSAVHYQNNDWTGYEPALEMVKSVPDGELIVAKEIKGLTQGKTYTVGCLLAGHRATNLLRIVNQADSAIIGSSNEVTDGYGRSISGWQIAKITFVATDSLMRLRFYCNPDAVNGYLWAKHVRCNEGTELLPYSQHPNEAYGITHKLTSQGYEMKDSNGSALITPNGVANEQNIGRVDNVEAGYPMKIPFHVGSEVSQITQAVLKWDMSQFRTYSKGAASGGGVRTTPSGGGSTSGPSSRSTAENSGPATFVSNTQTELSYPNEGKHYHRITAQQMEHSHGMAHTHTTPSHSHSVDITHEHAPVFGILETGITVDYTVGIEIDGVYRAQPNATRGEIDLSAWITTNGWHELILYVNGIKRLDANLFLKTYIRR